MSGGILNDRTTMWPGKWTGKPFEMIDFSVVNSKYFEFPDRRNKSIVDGGILPVMVGGWGLPQGGGKSTLAQVGLDGYKSRWRNFQSLEILGGTK